MLVLTRDRMEVVSIGDAIRVQVLEVRGSRVRLGIEAPRSIPVHRFEILERIAKEGSPNVHGNVCPCCGK